MTQVTLPIAQTEKEMSIVGNAWINERSGKTFINVKFNKGVIMNGIDENCNLLLQTNPRGKREGKKDPDFMVSILTPKVNAT